MVKYKDDKKLKDCKTNCCGVDFIEDTDVCRKCKEHAGPIERGEENGK